jgi:predicted ATPase
MKRLVIIKIMPNVIANESSKESPFLSNNIENYVSWYRYIFDSSSALFNKNEEKPVNRLTQALQDIFDAFVGFRLEIISEKIVALKLMFANKDGYRNYDEYSLSELSDGEKNLIVLYSLFYGLESKDYTLCIDEPENFLALPEIQPWLFQLYDLCSEGKLQALLISHHPELINYLLASPVGYWFERESNSRVKVKPITNQESEESGLSMSELIARGWLNG